MVKAVLSDPGQYSDPRFVLLVGPAVYDSFVDSYRRALGLGPT
jgi:hypothetical protein